MCSFKKMSKPFKYTKFDADTNEGLLDNQLHVTESNKPLLNVGYTPWNLELYQRLKAIYRYFKYASSTKFKFRLGLLKQNVYIYELNIGWGRNKRKNYVFFLCFKPSVQVMFTSYYVRHVV